MFDYVSNLRLKQSFVYCGQSKAKMIYETERSAPPVEPRDQFANNSIS